MERSFRGEKIYWRGYLQNSGPRGQASFDLNAESERARKPPSLFQPFMAYSWTIGSMASWTFGLLDADHPQQMIVELADLKKAEYEDDGDIVASWMMRRKRSVFVIRFDRDSGMMPIAFTLRAAEREADFDVLMNQPVKYKTGMVWKKFRDGVWRPVRVKVDEGSKDATLRQTIRWNGSEHYGQSQATGARSTEVRS